MLLCRTCWLFLCSRRYDGDIPWTNQHKTSDDLDRAVQARCWICVLFCRSLLPDIQEALRTSPHSETCQMTMIQLTSDGIVVRITCRCSAVALERWPQRLLSYSDLALKPRYIDSVELTEPSEGRKSTSRKTSNTSGDKEALRLARGWIATCRNTHIKCRLPNNEVWYPTRLIDLRKTKIDNTVQLVITRTESISGPYMSLSHCWGAKKFFCLTNSTFDCMRTGVNTSILTKTFQEAIEVCLALTVEFLWIDSLCIIQDSEGAADWLEESQYMDKVYAHALCNISATASENGDRGLFRSRDADLLISELLDIPDHPGTTSKYELFDGRYWHKTIEEAILLSRAWVFQERLIARRALHFTEDEVAWECSELRACESFPEGLSRGVGGQTSDLNLGMESQLDMETLPNVGIQPGSPQCVQLYTSMLYRHWWTLLRQYTNTKLTFEDDRPLAISAVAKRFQPYMEDVYSGGMWQKRLYTELLWESTRIYDTDESPFASVRKYSPPSFSWLSVAGPIDNILAYQEIQPLVNIIGLELDLVTGDPRGLVNSGKLHLQGKLRRIKMNRYEYGSSWDVSFDPTTVEPLSQEHQNWYPAAQADYSTLQGHPDRTHEFLLLANHQDLHYYCIPVATIAGGYTVNSYWCMILEHHESNGSSVFKRIGFSRIPPNKIPHWQEGEAQFPSTSYDPQTRWHVVCIT